MHPREVGQIDPLASVAHEILKAWSLRTVQDQSELLVQRFDFEKHPYPLLLMLAASLMKLATLLMMMVHLKHFLN